MTHPFIEHVNLTVSDAERTAGLISGIFGWHERWRGGARDGGTAIHVGSDRSYLAVYSGPDGKYAGDRYPQCAPLNHVGIQVDDLATIEARVKAAGLATFNHDDHPPGRRFYFLDHDGIEYEVFSYAEQKTMPSDATYERLSRFHLILK